MADIEEKIPVSPAFISQIQGVQNALGGINPGVEPEFDVSKVEGVVKVGEDAPPADAPPADTPPADAPPADTPPADTPPADTPPADTPPADAPPAEKGDTPTADPIKVESEIFGGAVELGEEKKEDAPSQSFETWEDINKFFEENSSLGIDLKNLPEELPKLVERNKEFEQVNARLQNYDTAFSNMPKALYDSLMAWDKGEDWRGKMRETATAIDFEKGFEDQNQAEIVNTFLPGKISSEDWEEFSDKDGDPAVKEKVSQAIEIAQEKFALNKEKYDLEKQKLIDSANAFKEKQQVAFNKSRENVVNAFQEAKLPLDEKYLQTVDKTISDEAILSLFKNADGTFKENVHQSVIMAQHGFDIVQQMYLAAKRQVASQARSEILERTPATPAAKKTGDADTPETKTSEKKVESHVASILGSKVAKGQ